MREISLAAHPHPSEHGWSVSCTCGWSSFASLHAIMSPALLKEELWRRFTAHACYVADAPRQRPSREAPLRLLDVAPIGVELAEEPRKVLLQFRNPVRA